MMGSNRLRLLAAGAAVLLSLPAFGAGGDHDHWMITGGTTAGIDLVSSSGTSSSTFSAQAGVGHSLGSHLELLALVNYAQAGSGATGVTTLGLDGQLDVVLGASHSDAFYVGGRGGLTNTQVSGVKTSGSEFGAVVGKRFALSPSVSYDPNVAYLFTGGNDTDLRIVPLQLTVFF